MGRMNAVWSWIRAHGGKLLLGLLALVLGAALLRWWMGPLVQTEAVQRRDLLQTVVASGRVETPHRVDIGAQITGTVARVPVVEGQAVKAGDVLIELVSTELQSAKRQARAKLVAVAQQFGLVPRTEMMDRRHAGWKGGMHDGAYYKQAYWFLPEYGEWFLQLWHRYLEQVARVERDHPFAFINLSREPVGAMYTLTQYNKAHAAACERIGLVVGKALGTTPHGHRHAYGQRLRRAGIDKSLIRRFMHHASEGSQEVYTQATLREAQAALELAAQRLRDKHAGTPSMPGRLLPDNELND